MVTLDVITRRASIPSMCNYVSVASSLDHDTKTIIGIMMETLYKTQTPEVGVSEFYELVILSKADKAPGGYTFKEIHGWWNDTEKKLIYEAVTISREDSVTWEEAQKMYYAARVQRAKSGFVHAFRPDYSGQAEHEYERIVEERKWNRGDRVAILIDSGSFRTGDVVPVTGIRTLRKQGGQLDRHEVYVVGADAAVWIPEDSVGAAPEE
jgi:hypothetical protein